MFSQLIIGALALANPSLAVCHYWDCPERSLEGTLEGTLDGSFERSLEAAAPELTDAVDLGRPREWANPGFKLFDTCDHAGPTEHTMAEMTINFYNSCEEVMTEIAARAGATATVWEDPHNRGHYGILAQEKNFLKVQRWTATYKYRDVQTFSMTASGSGCKVNACSVSQGNSNNDQGTNYCNMGNLFCNTATASPSTGVKCKSLKHNLKYNIPYMECGRYDAQGQYLEHNCQPFTRTCMRNPSTALEELPAAAPELTEAVVLGRPREWANPSFQLFETCPGSGATEHTLAEMTVEFKNSCEEVRAEIAARAEATANEWRDPHNRGDYTMLFNADRGDFIKVRRWTGNRQYKDKATFEMKASGSGCKVKACSESQGNSNNDQGTNMCNMGNLFCNTSVANPRTGVKCKSLKFNLQYTMSYMECGRYDGQGQYLQHNCQEFTKTCLRNPALEEGSVKVLKYIASE